ncbi:hypothetical protein F4804DRAFT_303680 [Jackrogersella minutella]|nr:hypothetical protein F4804DRAFT_303680 [Jackrogersella minutella]
MAETSLSSATTISTAFTSGTSYEVVDIFTRAPDQTSFVFSTQLWYTFASSASLTTSPSSRTDSSAATYTSSSTASTSSIKNAQSIRPSNSSGLSTGATVGIAVGCAAAGLILGAIAGFLFFRRPKSQGSKARYNVASYANQEKPLRSPYSSPFSTNKLQLEQFLLDSTPDTEIEKEMRSLGYLLQQHVESCYHTLPVSSSVDALSMILVHLGLDRNSTMSAIKLASLVLDPKTRYSAIQHVIARVTFASVTFEGVSYISLLPQPVPSFISLIPATESHRGSSEAVNTALSQWRQLSAFLLHPSRSDRTPLAPSEDISTHQAQQLAVVLNTFLEPFVAGDREDRYEQESHLREVIVECATFGYLLFSQPAEYRYRFEGGVRPNHMVVFPGLDRVSEDEGHRSLSPVQPVVAPVIETI